MRTTFPRKPAAVNGGELSHSSRAAEGRKLTFNARFNRFWCHLVALRPLLSKGYDQSPDCGGEYRGEQDLICFHD